MIVLACCLLLMMIHELNALSLPKTILPKKFALSALSFLPVFIFNFLIVSKC